MWGHPHGGEGSAPGWLAIAGALPVILIHHLGYAEFRSPKASLKLVGSLFGCRAGAPTLRVNGGWRQAAPGRSLRPSIGHRVPPSRRSSSVSFAQWSVGVVPVLAFRPGLWGIVALGLGIALALYAGYYLIFRMGK